jgi:hypothetical protein
MFCRAGIETGEDGSAGQARKLEEDVGGFEECVNGYRLQTKKTLPLHIMSFLFSTGRDLERVGFGYSELEL